MIDDPGFDPFLLAIIASPADDLPRLIACDWLDEHGYGWLAGYVRGRITIPASTERYSRLPCGDFPPLDNRGYTLRRGFAESIRCSVAWWLQHGADMLGRQPVTRVEFALASNPDRVLLERGANQSAESFLAVADESASRFIRMESTAVPRPEIADPAHGVEFTRHVQSGTVTWLRNGHVVSARTDNGLVLFGDPRGAPWLFLGWAWRAFPSGWSEAHIDDLFRVAVAFLPHESGAIDADDPAHGARTILVALRLTAHFFDMRETQRDIFDAPPFVGRREVLAEMPALRRRCRWNADGSPVYPTSHPRPLQ